MTGLRRFWTGAAVSPHAGGWAVLLDGKLALTPGRAALATSHRRLADAVASEWAESPVQVDPRAMPLTGFLNATIDRVGPHHAAQSADVAAFAVSELICYRAEGPEALCARQAAGWDPVLAWLARRYGVRLTCRAGITPILQPDSALKRLTDAVGALDPYRLTAALKLTGILKSLALTLAVLDNERDAIAAYELSRIDETFQAEQWGEDAEATRRVDRERNEVTQTAAFLALLD